MNYKLIETCHISPEQYDVMLNGNQVGYLRLRHGYFTVECPGIFNELVYKAEPKGDGRFCDDEREYYLLEAIKTIHNHLEMFESEEFTYEIVK